MIRLTVSYPSAPGARFDFDYYTTKHLELVRDRMRESSLESVAVEKGVSGGAPDSAAPFVCVATMTFRDAARFQAAWAKAVPDLLADVPNYTDTSPVVQIGEIVAR